MSTLKITWHRGKHELYDGDERDADWIAKLGDEIVARVYRNEGTPISYWNAYKVQLAGPLFIRPPAKGENSDRPAYLRDAKAWVQRRFEAVKDTLEVKAP